ncbi:unnamed protein product [Debaryomyces tyrocola]|nr:unnamed protein product [Debaryomyces tyrocola]
MTIDIVDDTSNNLKRKAGGSGSHGYNNSNYYKCFQNYYHGHNYLNPNPQYITNIKASVNHWQLRDLIQVDQENGKLYHTKDDSIREVNLVNNDKIGSDKHMEWDYFPKCFSHTRGGIVVTGGLLSSSSKAYSMNLSSLSSADKTTKSFRTPKGLFSFYNPETGMGETVKLGDVINNSVSVYPHASSQYKSYVCNNDSNLYVVDISGDRLSLDNKINCELNTSLNNVCRSPTNDKLVTVTGDSSSIFLLDPSSNSKIKTIKTDHDSGFGISYHPNGHLFATAFQDGTCSLYDIRNLSNPLSEIKSTRPGHQAGAFRCCKFANSSVNDFLVILEHVGRVHLFDLRNLGNENTNDHQVIVFPFALDQYADYKEQQLNVETKLSGEEKEVQDSIEDEDQVSHRKFGIYGDSSNLFRSNEIGEIKRKSDLQFTAPLVYDYDYLTNVNPKLFKNYTYQTPPTSNGPDNLYLPPPEFNYPQWNTDSNDSSDDISPENTRASISIPPQQPDPNFQFGPGQNSTIEHLTHPGSAESSSNAHTAARSNSSYDTYYQEAYQKSVNHIHGEMELAGVDWFDRQLLIGCEDGGVLNWDINVLGRRSFGSFSYV